MNRNIPFLSALGAIEGLGGLLPDVGTLISDALVAMDYPIPKPETVVKAEKQYLDGFALTMVLCAMGHGYDA